jgi:hypothetical protein
MATSTAACESNQATFTGLLPLGAPLANINNVEVEIYHVFPFDSLESR